MNKNFRPSKRYKKGDILLAEEPFVFLLKGSLSSERCDYCFKKSQLMKCTGCSSAHYCDRKCQKNGWTYHKFECSNIKRILPNVAPDAARMMARIIIKLHQGGATEKSYYTDTKFRVFRDLMSHYNEIKKDTKRMEHFTSLGFVLSKYLEGQFMPNEAELLAIYGKMVINSFMITDAEMQTLGTGIYLAASIIDHSCSPNAVALFDGTKIIIRTLKDLNSLDWMKVHISYIELLNLPSVRQKELDSNYYFSCRCEKCLDQEELNRMTATICQNENCYGCIDGGGREATTKCPRCEETVSQETKRRVAEVVQFTKEQIDKMQDIAYLDICKVCLTKQENLLHEENIYKVKILDLAMDGCICIENWESALQYGRRLLGPFLKYYGDLHPTRGIFLMKMGKMANLLEETDEAIAYFKQAASVLSVTHGSGHPLVKESLVTCYQLSRIEVKPKIVKHQKRIKLSIGEILKMGSSPIPIKASKPEKDLRRPAALEKTESTQLTKSTATRNILTAIGSRYFNGSPEFSEAKKLEEALAPALNHSSSKDKSMSVEKVPHGKELKKFVQHRRSKLEEAQENRKKSDRDFRKFKTKYNNGIGNIMRNWMGLIYCILILRMNLIKFILEKIPDFDRSNAQLQNQILLESRTMYNMIRKAQDYSHERSLHLWMHLEKLIFSRMFLKRAIETMQSKESGIRDWKGASAKLTQVQEELEKAQNLYRDLQKSKIQSENAAKEKLIRLECLTNSKNTEMEQLIEQITECKKREVQVRGKILLNMKNYKDLKTKREYLINVEKELNQMKNDQDVLVQKYSDKIEILKSQIEEKEKQIQLEKEEKKKLKANLDGFGDFGDGRSLVSLIEN